MARNIPKGYAYEPRVSLMHFNAHENETVDFEALVLLDIVNRIVRVLKLQLCAIIMNVDVAVKLSSDVLAAHSNSCFTLNPRFTALYIYNESLETTLSGMSLLLIPFE